MSEGIIAIDSLLACPTGPLVLPPLDGEAIVDLSLVLPTYNEGKNIVPMLEQLITVLDSVAHLQYEVIVVDDDSPDCTWEKSLGFAEKHPQVRVIRRQGERGLSTAVIRGWQAARGRFLGVMDADLQHPPEVAANIAREMMRGADLAIASRHVEGGGVSDWSLARTTSWRRSRIAWRRLRRLSSRQGRTRCRCGLSEVGLYKGGWSTTPPG